ncbi:MAG: retron St85 family RNA-directed DNA polymerase [Paracoccaceae bacterium]
MTQTDASLSEWQEFFNDRVKRPGSLVSGYLSYVSRMQSLGVPPLFELRHISKILAIDEALLVGMINRTNQFYRDFEIPKRRGGFRSISVPSPTLLYVQRWIASEVLSKQEVHDAAHGFVKGRSVVSNANVHKDSRSILKMDITDFFPSVQLKRVIKVFLSLGYPVSVSFFLASLCCYKKVLPQGAATSPALSNLIAGRLDKSLATYAHGRGLHYSRYADDLVFSGEKIEKVDITRIGFLINRYDFKVNEKKTRILLENRKRIITGISVSDGKLGLPRKTRRDIQSQVHRLVKFGFSEFSDHSGGYDPLIYERVLGRLGFWLQVDPENSTAQKLQSVMQAEIQKNEIRYASQFKALPSLDEFAGGDSRSNNLGGTTQTD